VITILPNISVTESGSITEPVTLDEAKAWAMIDHEDHDDLVTGMITGAREDIERELDAKLVESDVSFTVEITKELEQLINLPHALNLSQVSDLVISALTDGEADEELTVDEDYYFNGSLKLPSGANKVEYTVTPVVPQAIKQAIMMLVAYRYNNRGDQGKQHGLPEDIERKIARFRKISL
jgi:hypothetical protein